MHSDVLSVEQDPVLSGTLSLYYTMHINLCQISSQTQGEECFNVFNGAARNGDKMIKIDFILSTAVRLLIFRNAVALTLLQAEEEPPHHRTWQTR